MSRTMQWTLLALGFVFVLLGIIDWAIDPESVNLKLYLSAGIIFVLLSQSEHINRKLERRGLIILLLIGMLILVGLLALYLATI